MLGGEGVRHRARDVLEEAHHPDGRRREDRLAVRLVVERDVPRDDGRLEGAAGEGDPLHRGGELAHDLGPLGVAEVEAVGDGERARARAGDVQRRLGDRVRGAAHRVGEAVPRVDVGREGEPLLRPFHAEDGGVSRRAEDGVRPHAPVVLAPDPGLAAEVRRGEEDEEGRLLVGRAVEVDRSLARRERLGERPGTAVDGCLVDERRDGKVGHDLAVPVEDHPRLARHLADLGDVQAPLLEDLDHLALAPLLRDEEHPLLRLGEHQLVGRHAGLAHRDLVEVEAHADVAARAHLERGRREARGPHVLDGDDGVPLEDLEDRLEEELLGERVADLDRRAPLRLLVVEDVGRHRGAVDAVAARLRAGVEDRVADPGGLRLEDPVVADEADRHDVDEDVPVVRRVEERRPADGRDADAVAVAADAADDAVDEAVHPRRARDRRRRAGRGRRSGARPS